MKISVAITVLLLLGCAVAGKPKYNIRFGDDQMMRKHHEHKVPNPDTLTVHLIPHSHDDVGWLKTVDEYFYGSQQQIQWAGVQYTIDTVVSELAAHPEYKFSIVEVAFLYRWWNNADNSSRETFKSLIKSGQIEFINGGWCMSDEATPYYEDFIDQMTIGLRWLKQTFDYVPDIAWHIDPFGHQASSASMFSKMGMQAFFFARIDYQDKEKRMSEKGLEMIWQPKLTVADPTNYIFTQVNYYHYSPPPGFCFDLKCQDEPIKDDPTMEDYNLESKAKDFVDYFKSMSLHFRSTSLMHTFGGDFQYANARMWYKNIDKLIKFINGKSEYGVKIQYSTPGSYIKEIQSQGIQYPTKQDDFFPYADRENAYWTGYFVSRVAVKGFVRDFGRWLQAVRKHVSEIKMRGTSEVISNSTAELESGIWGLQMAMGILQHHDAVSGTEKQKVADDYIATALRAIPKFVSVYRRIVKEQIATEVGETLEQEIKFNIYWNETAQQTGMADILNANKTVLLNLYNPGQAQNRQIRVSVPAHSLHVQNADNQPINGNVFCANLWDASHCELIFSIDLPESANTYVKLRVDDTESATAKVEKLKELTLVVAAKGFKLTETASLKIKIASEQFGLTVGQNTDSFTVNYNYYESYAGEGQKSGAYIFRPASNTPKKYSKAKKIHYAEGTQAVFIVLERDRTISKLLFSKVAGYIDSKGFEIETRVDSIPISDGVGKEVTLNLRSRFSNNKTFYTDSNGLEEQVRVVNYRPTWPLVVNEQVSGNYYPVNSHIGFVDVNSNRKLTVVTDRSEGGTVIRDGEIELMIHRRTLHDDARGVGEPLNETQADGRGLIQNLRHYVVFGNDYRKVQMQNDQKVAISFAESASPSFAKHSVGPAPIPVPASVKLYLRPFSDNSYLMRVQSFSSEAVSVDVPSGWQATEYTLSANQLQADWQQKQYKWSKESKWKPARDERVPDNSISLNFLQIRTFKITKSQIVIE